MFDEDAGPRTRVIPLRVHRGQSGLDDATLRAVLAEVDTIWETQANICFAVEVVAHDRVADVGLDLWFVVELEEAGLNGYFSDAHAIYSIDYPALDFAPNPTAHPAARTAAHEIGHAFGLAHDNCGVACFDRLMTSGRRGSVLNADEVSAARAGALAFAERDAECMLDGLDEP